MLKIGAAETAITPPDGSLLIGPLAPSTGVHDDLYCRAFVLDDKESRAVVVTADLVGLDFGMVDRFRVEIERRTGIPPERVMINTSHTHSAPFTIPWSVLGWESFCEHLHAWRDELVAKVSDAVASAVSRLRPAVLHGGREAVRIGFNRRMSTPDGIRMQPNPEGVVVPWTDVLYAADVEGEPLSLLLSHAAHPVIVHGASTLISADYPGYAVAAVRRLLGPNVVGMFAQGCGADSNGYPLRAGFDAAWRAGTLLGAAAAKGALEAEPVEAGPLACLSETLALPFLAAPSAECVEEAIAAFGDVPSVSRDASPDRAEPPESWYRRDAIACCRELLGIVERQESPRLRFEIQAFALGPEFCLLGMTHEVFAEYQLAIDQFSPFKHTMVLGYANGCEAYVPAGRESQTGGYETAPVPEPGAPLKYRNRLNLPARVESDIKEAVRSLLLRLHGQCARAGGL